MQLEYDGFPLGQTLPIFFIRELSMVSGRVFLQRGFLEGGRLVDWP